MTATSPPAVAYRSQRALDDRARRPCAAAPADSALSPAVRARSMLSFKIRPSTSEGRVDRYSSTSYFRRRDPPTSGPGSAVPGDRSRSPMCRVVRRLRTSVSVRALIVVSPDRSNVRQRRFQFRRGLKSPIGIRLERPGDDVAQSGGYLPIDLRRSGKRLRHRGDYVERLLSTRTAFAPSPFRTAPRRG